MKRPGTELAARLFGSSPETTLALLRAAWPAAVGPELASRTEVVALDSGVLRVRVPDAGWQRALQRMRGDILRRLRDLAGSAAPRSLGFVEGTVRAPEAKIVVVSPPAPRPLTPALTAAAEAIPDPQVRERFLASAARYLTRFEG